MLYGSYLAVDGIDNVLLGLRENDDIHLCPLEHVLDIFYGKLLIKRYDTAGAVCRCKICYIPFVSGLRENSYPRTLLNGIHKVSSERVDIMIVFLGRDGDIVSALLLLNEEDRIARELLDTFLDNVS